MGRKEAVVRVDLMQALITKVNNGEAITKKDRKLAEQHNIDLELIEGVFYVEDEDE